MTNNDDGWDDNDEGDGDNDGATRITGTMKRVMTMGRATVDKVNPPCPF
jgi:hypothetical protein